MMVWSAKSQHAHNTSKCTEFDGGSEFGQQKVNILIIHQNVQNLTADPNLVNK